MPIRFLMKYIYAQIFMDTCLKLETKLYLFLLEYDTTLKLARTQNIERTVCYQFSKTMHFIEN